MFSLHTDGWSSTTNNDGVDQGSDKYEKGSSSSEKFPVVYGEEMIENIVL